MTVPRFPPGQTGTPRPVRASVQGLAANGGARPRSPAAETVDRWYQPDRSGGPARVTTRSALRSALLAAVCAGLATPALADDVPGWLAPHVGVGDGQIAAPVLQRARSLYLRKSAEGRVSNPCWFAMDATRPNDPDGGRFYVVCEAEQSFSAIPAGHGSGLDLPGAADFRNGRRCAKNFGNAADSNLTTGGSYVTGEARTSFKGFFRDAGGGTSPFLRTFVPFEGEGETANARSREIGGHAAVTMKGVCLRRDPGNPYADPQGFVRFGHLVDYAGGRSNGCTSWSAADAAKIGAMVEGRPTTLYIYPEAADVREAARGAGYWDATCRAEIGAPKFWPRAVLEPIIARYKAAHPPPPPRPTPLCTGE